MPIALPRVAALDAAVAALLLPSVRRRSAAPAAVVTSPCCAAAAAFVVSRRDTAARRVSEHVGLSLVVSRRRLAINGAAAAHATLPHRLHAHVLALAPEKYFVWRILLVGIDGSLYLIVRCLFSFHCLNSAL